MNRSPIESEELDRDPFEELASEFAERYRNGELPSIEEYATSHPDLADEIRELFPTIAAMEKSKAKSPTPKPLVQELPIQQLGDFRLLGEIGRGGMGIVYEAEQVSLGRHVAVKVLPQQALLDERHLRRFEREAQTAAQLHHTNIVPVFGVGQQDGFHYIVMQFISGVGLDEVLLALRRQVFQHESEDPAFLASSSSRVSHANYNAQALLKGDFSELPLGKLNSSFVKPATATQVAATVIAGQPTTGVASRTIEFSMEHESTSESVPEMVLEDEAKHLKSLGGEFYQSVARVGEQVANALAYAHEQGTLHRDIKPGNLLLDSTGTVWVADFGLAKFAEQDNVSRTGDIVGTLSYIPPESFSGQTDARGDIYSLGLSLFELLTLRPAYLGRDRGKLVREITEGNLPRLKKLNPNIPRDLETIVLKAVAHQPEDRYASAADLASDLSCFLNDRPIRARRMSIPEQFARWYRKNKLVAALSTAVLMLLLASTVSFAVLTHRANKSATEAQEQTTKAQREKRVADRERQNARELLYESIQALKSVFLGFAPIRLPVSASSSLAQNSSLTSQELTSSDKNSGDATDGSQSADLIAPPPIKQETAARLEILLGSLEKLAAKAESHAEFAGTFADLTLRVGTLHKTLGNNERAAESLDKAISRYESLVSVDDAIENVIGLAVCYNEKADLLGTMNDNDSHALFRRAQKLLDKQKETGRLQESPRAQYELARTLFLMSIQRQRIEGEGGSRRSPRRFGLFGGASKNLRRAIDVLEPLTETQSNSEYRYLLARCYSALSSALRPHEPPEVYVSKANLVLAELVESHPGVDDYKYEFAMAKLRRINNIADMDERLDVTKDATDLLDQICGSNPDVFNYQIARTRALGRYVKALDRTASQLATSVDEEDFNLSLILRRDATYEAERAIELYLDLKERFDDAFSERIPITYQVQLAEVIAKEAPETAIEYFRDEINNERGILPLARAELGLARSLIMSNYGYEEASEILDELHEKLLKRCQKDAGRWPNGRFNEVFSLFVECSYTFQGSLDKARPMIQAIRDERIASIEKELPKQLASILPVLGAELDIKTATALARLGESKAAESLRSQAAAALKQTFEGKAKAGRFAAAHVLFELYDEVDDVEAKLTLREKLFKLPPPRHGAPGQGPKPPAR